MEKTFFQPQIRGTALRAISRFRESWLILLCMVFVAMLDFSGKANTSIHGLGEDDTANSQARMFKGCDRWMCVFIV